MIPSSHARLIELDAKSLSWLRESVIPLWTRAGFDSASGMFEESLTSGGLPAREPRRAMVQARQIYSMKTAEELGALSSDLAQDLTLKAATSLRDRFQTPSGGYLHSLRADGSVNDSRCDLYTQAFAIFGMACAYPLHRDASLRASAIRVLEFLRQERAVGTGGYSEISPDGQFTYGSNPHMHLFEAALEWMEFDQDPVWRKFADEIADLAVSKFIDPEGSGFLAEHFDSEWSIKREADGKFMFEPGHQFEWAWLLARYAKLTGRSLTEVSAKLYESGNKGVFNGFAVDEMWSDWTVRLGTARFWPQAERAKAASLAVSVHDASEAISALFTYLQTPLVGLWFDSRRADGSFAGGNAKGSSLYHIIGAISEFHKLASATAAR